MRGGPGPPLPIVAAALLSGAAALVYQVLWTRELALVVGHTVAAVSTVLATFMAGLALGSGLAARYARRMSAGSAGRIYALLEIGIAGAAVALPLLTRAGTVPLAALYGSGGAPALALESARLALSAALLLVPKSIHSVR